MILDIIWNIVKIIEKIVKKYNLSKEETAFFDDKQKNVDAACRYGLKGYLFRSVDDIKKADL